MRNLKSILAMTLLVGATQMALAKPVHAADVNADVKAGVQSDTDKSQSTGRMSDEATINANSPAVGQEKGQDHATERKAIDHTNKDKRKSKTPSTNSGDSSQY